MNDQTKKFFDLVKETEILHKRLSEINTELTGTMGLMGFGTYVQDPETRLVYKIVKPKGTFMYYKEIDYVRTAKEGERGGTVLAKKEAEEAGFVLSK